MWSPVPTTPWPWDLKYECAKYRRGDAVLGKENWRCADEHQPSGYYRPKFEEKLPKQSLLLYNRKEGGQKLNVITIEQTQEGARCLI